MTDWIYYRLLSDEGMVIGFLRVKGNRHHYVTLRSERWSRTPIEYYDCVRLAGPLPGFGYLKEPQ